MPFVWGLLALAILLGVFWLSYSVSPGNHPAEYEAVVVEKWANYSETDEGSVPNFRLLVELTNGQKLTIRVGPDLYNEVKVGSRIRKSSKGLELVKAALDKSDKAGCIPHETTVIGLASKVFFNLGFAVRCEAVAVPRRQASVVEWGLPPKRFC